MIHLDTVVGLYNSTPHTSLPRNKSPGRVYDSLRLMTEIYEANLRHNISLKIDLPFKAGDRVRHILPKKQFAKEGANWSAEVYEVVGLAGNKYIIKSTSSTDGVQLNQAFRPTELLATPIVQEKMTLLKEDSRTKRVW